MAATRTTSNASSRRPHRRPSRLCTTTSSLTMTGSGSRIRLQTRLRGTLPGCAPVNRTAPRAPWAQVAAAPHRAWRRSTAWPTWEMRLRARGWSGQPTRLSFAAASSSASGRFCHRRPRLPRRLPRLPRLQPLQRVLRCLHRCLRFARTRAPTLGAARATTAAPAPSSHIARTAPTASTAAPAPGERRRLLRHHLHQARRLTAESSSA